MKILITGGAGYIGSACARYFKRCGHVPYVYDDCSLGFEQSIPGIKLINNNIVVNDHIMPTVMEQYGIEAVCHLAALASVPDSIKRPAAYYQTNVHGTQMVLDSMRRAGVNRILFASTAAVYQHSDEPVTEESTIDPQTPYGSTKLAAERMIKDYAAAYHLDYTIFRFFNAAGASSDGQYGECRRHETHLIPLLINYLLGRNPNFAVYGANWLRKPGDDTYIRDYVHVDDIAAAFGLAIGRPAVNDVYNLGSGVGCSIKDVFEASSKAITSYGGELYSDWSMVKREPGRPGDPRILWTAIDKAKLGLGWAPQYGIDAIIRSAVRWHMTNLNGYINDSR